jgi:DNA replication protein DnaC
LNSIVSGIPLWWNPEEVPDQVKKGNELPAIFVRAWVGKKKSLWPGYLYHGNAGRGKTSAALMLAWEVGRCGYYSKFITAEDALTSLKATWNPRSQLTAQDVIADYRRPLLLVLDDVGTRDYSAEERALFYQLIIGRLNASLPTILTTNLRLPEQAVRFTESLDGRILDRYRAWLVNGDKWGSTLRDRRPDA